MEPVRKVKVRSTQNAEVGVTLPDLRFSRTWAKKDMVIPIEFEILKEALYDVGFLYMIEQGILYIEDLKDKVDLGLESEAETEMRIIVLNDGQMLNLLKNKTPQDLEEMLEKVPYSQRHSLANKAIELEITDMARADIFKKYTETDIISAVQLARKAKED